MRFRHAPWCTRLRPRELEQGGRTVLSGPPQSQYTFGIYAPSKENFHALLCVRIFPVGDLLGIPYRGESNLDFDVAFDSSDFPPRYPQKEYAFVTGTLKSRLEQRSYAEAQQVQWTLRTKRKVFRGDL